VVLKPAEQTPVTAILLMELIGDLLPAGVLNIVNGFGLEAGKPLAESPRVSKVAFTGETTTGRLIMQYASNNLNPVTLELGGKSPNVFFADVWERDDAFRNKCLEGFAMFALNQGQTCTCPSRVIVDEGIWDEFLPAAVARTEAIKIGNPLDVNTVMGAITSQQQLNKILSYIEIGKEEGVEYLTGGNRFEMGGGFYMEPTVFTGHNKMRMFQEEIFGPVVGVTKFSGVDQAIEIANDTIYGLAGAVWSRNGNIASKAASAIEAGRVWVNAYHLYPVHAAFGGYKNSGIGRETHKMMLDHYQQTKSVIVSTSEDALGFY